MPHANDIAAALAADLATSLPGDGARRATPDVIAELVGASLVEQWVRGYGVSSAGGLVTQWVGQKAGIVIPGTGAERPALAANGNIITNGSSTRLDQTADMSPAMLGASSRVYMCSVMRRGALAGTLAFTLSRQPSGNAPAFDFRGDATTVGVTASVTGQSATAPLTDTSSLHIFEGWIANSALRFRLDGGSVVSTAFATNALGYDAVRVSVGGGSNTWGLWGAYEHAAHIVANQYPGDAATAALRAYLREALEF